MSSQKIPEKLLGSERKAKRFKTREKATVQIDGQKEILHAIVNNISESGASLALKEGGRYPRKGERINVTLHLSNVNKVYEIVAFVAWSKHSKLGIRFISKKEANQKEDGQA